MMPELVRDSPDQAGGDEVHALGQQEHVPQDRAPSPGRRSRRTQFALRSLLGLMLLACLAATWLGSMIQDGRRQHQAISAIKQKGAEVICVSWESHEWLEWLVGEDAILDVVGVLFAPDSVVDDECLASLSQFPKLQTLDLAGTCIDDAKLVHLKDLKTLQVLRLDGTRVSDAGLVQIANLSQLEELDLSNTLITNAGLQQLAGLPRLRSVDLTHTRVSHAGIVEHFGPLGPPFFVTY